MLVVDSVLHDMEASYGAIEVWNGDLIVTRSTIANNTITDLSGAVKCINSNASLINSTITGNHASGGQSVFAGFYGQACNASIDRCTIVENEPYELAVSTNQPGTTTLRNNFVFGSCPSTNTGLITSQGGNVASSTSAETYCGIDRPADQVLPGGPYVMPLGYFGGYAPTRLPQYVHPNHPLGGGCFVPRQLVARDAYRHAEGDHCRSRRRVKP